MTAETTLFTTLTTDADVAPLIVNNTSPLTYRLFTEPQDNVVKPYVVYFLVTANVPVDLLDYADKENCRFQIDVYATTPSAARTLADHIVDAVNTGMSLSEIYKSSFYEQDTKLHRMSLDLSVWN